jgi:UDP-N-acetylglucosamine--N-acetylmuramyl-(pentapeptide) pyrophosphoryl-undecaprenol N-acetylglucosamine transferase
VTTVLIAGGGTGGHVFPMVAVGDALRVERPRTRVAYVGTARGIEGRVMGARGDELHLLEVLPLRGRGAKGFLLGAGRALAVLPAARRLVRELAADVVFSVGGYAAGPVTLAARSLGIPVTLLEPNAVAGFTNRLLAPWVTRAYVAFPEVRASLRATKVEWTGVPLRRRFSPAPYPEPDRAARVLVVGGSQGALALNQTVPRAVAACRDQGVALQVVHQTGRDKEAEVHELYRELGLADSVEVVPFIEDVAEAIARAEVVVGRAGASSLAELCAVGRPGILIPYPHAADDQQRRNAESLERAGAARCVVQAEASPERLTRELVALAGDPARRRRMAERAAERGRPDAARDVARDLLRLAETTEVAP